MGKITPNRIAFVILPEEVTLVLYILYILLGAREHIIHTYIHTYIATILLVTHVSNISLCTSAISRYCVAGGLFGQRQKNWAGKTRWALWLFGAFSQLFSHSRETNRPLRRQGVSHFVLLFNKKIPQTTHVDYKVTQKNWNKKCCIILKHKRNVLFFLRIKLFDIGVSQIRRYRI